MLIFVIFPVWLLGTSTLDLSLSRVITDSSLFISCPSFTQGQIPQAQQQEHQHMRADMWQASSPQVASVSSYAADLPIHHSFAAAPTPNWRGEGAPWDSNGPLSLRCDSSANYHVLEEDGAAYGRADDAAYTACDDADQVKICHLFHRCPPPACRSSFLLPLRLSLSITFFHSVFRSNS